MTLMSMTFQEEYGELPTMVLRGYRRWKVTVHEHDRLVAMCQTPEGTDWSLLYDLLCTHSSSGRLALPLYF